MPGARLSAVLLVSVLLPALGCANGLGFSSPDPMHGELKRLEAEQKRMAEQARLADEAAEARRSEDPPDFADRMERGDAHLEAGRIGEALWEYAAAHRLDPQAAAPRVRLGYVHLRHEPERARPLFESALDLEPDYASAHTGLGLALLDGGERRQGMRHLERAVELAPRSAQAQAALGVALDQTGRSEEGLTHLEQARALRPRDARILNNLGVAYLRSGDPERAEPLLRAALREDTRDQSLRANNLGMALALQGRFEEALDSFRRGGSEQAARNNLGYAHFVRGEYERAIAEYERALVVGGEASVEVVRNLQAARVARHDGAAPTRGSAPQPATSAAEAEPGDGAPEPPGEATGALAADRPGGTAPIAEGEREMPEGDPWLRPAPPGKRDPDA